eukprot:15354938-Ditylum_brightwellii.AAC.1
MTMHAIGLILFRHLKNFIFTWLKQNSIFLSMTIFRNTNETVMRIGYLTKINHVCIYHAHCQEQLNKVLIVVAAEVE